MVKEVERSEYSAQSEININLRISDMPNAQNVPPPSAEVKANPGVQSGEQQYWRTKYRPTSATKTPQQPAPKLAPKWLLWTLSIGLGTIGTGVLVACLALMTPLWTKMDSLNDDLGLSTTETAKETRSPAELWRNLEQYQLKRPMNVLVLGVEPVPGAAPGSVEALKGNSDAMLLIRFNPEDKTLRVLSIPRDSMGAIPDVGLNKLSVANARGGSAAVRVLSRTFNNVQIDRFVRISTSAFRELIDQLGGVSVYVPERIVVKDTARNVTVDLNKGRQMLNGEQAEKFARYREAAPGDLKRLQRQQTLIKALRDRVTDPAIVPRLAQLAPVMGKYVDTNLKRDEILALVNFTVNVPPQDFQMYILPGSLSPLSQDPNSYWIDWAGQIRLMGQYFGAKIGAVPEPDSRPVSSLRIAVQNASGQTNLTQKVVKTLRSKGMKAVYAAPDWQDGHQQTQIIAQKGNHRAATELQQILGLGSIQVAATGDLGSDLTIRIGRDWK